jgi:hypothetical protein
MNKIEMIVSGHDFAVGKLDDKYIFTQKIETT